MNISKTLARLRKENGLTQSAAAGFVRERSGKSCTSKSVSNWETGVAMPSVDQFLWLCELYGVGDVLAFRDLSGEYRGIGKLNALGKSRVEEYITMLSGNALFAESQDGYYDVVKPQRVIKLYDIPVAAGTGFFLDSDAYEDLEVDKTVPQNADFAVRVSGDSMTPRFVDGQIVFIKEQQTLDVGEIGIFALDGDSYIKRLGHGELLSLNARYRPIKIREYALFHVFGKVVG